MPGWAGCTTLSALLYVFAVATPTSIVWPFSVVTTLPGAFGSFQSTANPTARLSSLQSLLCVVQAHAPRTVTVREPSELTVTLPVVDEMTGSAASAPAPATPTTRPTMPQSNKTRTRFELT